MKKNDKPKTTADHIAEQAYYTREIYKRVHFWHSVGMILLILWLAGLALIVIVSIVR